LDFTTTTKLFACTLTLAVVTPLMVLAAGDAVKGKEVFQPCSVCHRTDSTDKKIGPGLKGLFQKKALSNGKKPTEENVRAFVDKGGGGMPAYADILTSQEKDDLLAYLKTL